MKYSAILLSAALWWGIQSPAAIASKSAKPSDEKGSAELFRVANRGTDAIEKGLHRKSSKEDLIQTINETREAYEKLKNFPPSKGDANLFRQYCEISVGILNDVEVQVNHSNWLAAEKSFDRIEDLKRDLNRDFRPGRWERFKGWWKSIF